MADRSLTGRVLLLGASASILIAYALHHGSYSLTDRQVPALLLWFGIATGALVGVLPAARPPRAVWLPLAAMAAMGAWALLSLSWTESSERSFAEFTRLIAYAGVLALIWLAVRKSTWRLVAAGMLTAGVAVCGLIVLSRLWPALFPPDSVANALGRTRINYPFGYWNSVGCWSAMTTTMCLAWAGHARSAAVRALALAAVPVCVLALYFALSRAGVGGTLLGALLVIVLGRNRWLTLLQAGVAAGASLAVILLARKQFELVYATGTEGAKKLAFVLALASAVCAVTALVAARADLGVRLRLDHKLGRRLGIAAAVIAVAGVCVVTALYGGEALKEFQGKTATPTVLSGDQRLAALSGNRHNVWESAWGAFRSEPVTGIGPGTFEFWWNRNGVNGEFLRDAHNIYLEALAEQGVAGLLFLLLFFAGLLVAGLRARSSIASDDGIGANAGLVAVFCVFLLQAGVDWMWESTAIAVFALAAIAIAATAASESWAERRSPALRFSIVVVSILAILTLLPGLTRQRNIEASAAAARAGDLSEAIDRADQAIQAEPWAASAFAQRALAKEAAGDLPGAARDIATAERKEPTNWRWPLIATRIAAAQGDTAGALRSYRRAKALRKYAKVFGAKSPAFR